MSGVSIRNNTGGPSKVPAAIEFHKRQIAAYEDGIAAQQARFERQVLAHESAMVGLEQSLQDERSALEALEE